MRLIACLLLLAFAGLADSVAGLKWTAPPGWKNEGSRPMRAATYMIPPSAGDHDAAECAVYFFGAPRKPDQAPEPCPSSQPPSTGAAS